MASYLKGFGGDCVLRAAVNGVLICAGTLHAKMSLACDMQPGDGSCQSVPLAMVRGGGDMDVDILLILVQALGLEVF